MAFKGVFESNSVNILKSLKVTCSAQNGKLLEKFAMLFWWRFVDVILMTSWLH